jgi:hypothetical protein
MADDNLHDWKALLVFCFFQGAAILSVEILVEELVDKFLFSNSLLLGAGPLAIALGLLNYFFLLHNDRWRHFERSFREYSKCRRRIGTISVILGMLAVASLYIAVILSIEPVVNAP